MDLFTVIQSFWDRMVPLYLSQMVGLFAHTAWTQGLGCWSLYIRSCKNGPVCIIDPNLGKEHGLLLDPICILCGSMAEWLRCWTCRSHPSPSVVQSNPRQVVYTRVPFCLCHEVVPAWAVMPCGWEGNRRSDIAQATRHIHYWFSP